jgi:hypothetical protein
MERLYIHVLHFHMWIESHYHEYLDKVRYASTCKFVSSKFKPLLEKHFEIIHKVKKIKIYGSKMKVTYHRDSKGKKKKYVYMDLSFEDIPQVLINCDSCTSHNDEQRLYESPEFRMSIK